MTNQEIKAFALEHHAEMQEKGFWQDKSMVKKALLIAGELAEALEAHRKNNRCSIAISIFENKNFENELIRTKFEKEVKDKFEDEIGDALLRLLDFSAFFEGLAFLGFHSSVFEANKNKILVSVDAIKKEYTSNELDALLLIANKEALNFNMITTYICLIEIAKLINFDLWEHVKAKRKYNSTRPFMFGKKY